MAAIIGGTVLVARFTAETGRAHQYDLAAQALQTSSIRVRLATLSSFGKWAVRRDTIARNPVDVLTPPRRKARLPRVRQWDRWSGCRSSVRIGARCHGSPAL